MKRLIPPLLLITLFIALGPLGAEAGEAGLFVLRGVISDKEGVAVGGGEVFIYNSAQTRRPADFITPRSGVDGRFSTKLPAGHYWLVARVRDGAAYGPLAIGKKHSGEAVEIDGVAGDDIEVDFLVADVREMARGREKREDNYLRLTGRIVDKEGRPFKGAYVFARDDDGREVIPDFISPTTGDDGVFDLYLPGVRYCVAASVLYPPAADTPCLLLQALEGQRDIPIEFHLELGNSDSQHGEIMKTEDE